MGTKGGFPVTFVDLEGDAVLGDTTKGNGGLLVTAVDTNRDYVDLSSGGGGEPSQYIKSIVEQENGLYTVTKQDNSTFNLFTETQTYEVVREEDIAISTNKVTLASFNLTELGDYKFDMFIDYKDDSNFNSVVIEVDQGANNLGSAVFPVVFDSGASIYSSVVSIPIINTTDPVTIGIYLAGSGGIVSRVYATAKKVLTQ